MKIDAKKIEEECQRTISYLKGYSYLKKPIANAVSITTRTTLHWMQGETKKLTLSKLLYRPLYSTCPFLFEEKYPESKNIASTENLLPFFINEGSHFEKKYFV